MRKVEGKVAVSAPSDEDVTTEGGPPGARVAMSVVAQQVAIARIGQRALEDAALSELLDEACALVCQMLGAEIASITELSADGETLRVVAGVGYRPGVVGTFTLLSLIHI